MIAEIVLSEAEYLATTAYLHGCWTDHSDFRLATLYGYIYRATMRAT